MPASRTTEKQQLRDRVDTILSECPLRAAAFIVTLYGDVVVPRGGVLWIGNVIDICGKVGINESLVRTSVSRLVASGHLVGERHGRRSFYRLSVPARKEFDDAADIIYSGNRLPDDAGWFIVHLPRDNGRTIAAERLQRAGFGMIGSDMAIAPASSRRSALLDELAAQSGLVFNARVDKPHDPGALRKFAVACWRLDDQAEAYRRFIRLFSAIRPEESACRTGSDLDCLVARLVLVHEFRHVVLRDPGLPDEALPADWPGSAARRLFASLYKALTQGADRWISSRFVDADGAITASGNVLDERLAAMDRTTEIAV